MLIENKHKQRINREKNYREVERKKIKENLKGTKTRKK